MAGGAIITFAALIAGGIVALTKLAEHVDGLKAEGHWPIYGDVPELPAAAKAGGITQERSDRRRTEHEIAPHRIVP
jgi:hypothetical protein